MQDVKQWRILNSKDRETERATKPELAERISDFVCLVTKSEYTSNWLNKSLYNVAHVNKLEISKSVFTPSEIEISSSIIYQNGQEEEIITSRTQKHQSLVTLFSNSIGNWRFIKIESQEYHLPLSQFFYLKTWKRVK